MQISTNVALRGVLSIQKALRKIRFSRGFSRSIAATNDFASLTELTGSLGPFLAMIRILNQLVRSVGEYNTKQREKA
jgi:hypothetical protein